MLAVLTKLPLIYDFQQDYGVSFQVLQRHPQTPPTRVEDYDPSPPGEVGPGQDGMFPEQYPGERTCMPAKAKGARGTGHI